MPKVIPMPGRVEKVVAERDQLSHGRLIHVVSVFPADGACSPEDKLKTLIDMDLKIPTQLRKGVDKPPRQR